MTEYQMRVIIEVNKKEHERQNSLHRVGNSHNNYSLFFY